MEEVKTSIEKIFDQFSADSLSYTMPKRLSYNYLNDTTESVSKKRKLSIDNNVSSNNLLNNISTISVEDESIDKNGTSQSFNSSQISQVSSPWEVRRLKADVIDYSSRLGNLKKEIENRATAYNHMESMYTSKVNGLQKQLDTNIAKVKDSDKHIKHLRKREATAKEDVVKVKNTLTENMRNYDDLVSTLQREKRDLENTLRHTQYESTQQITNLENQYNEMEKNYIYVREQLEALQENTTQLQEKGRKYNELDEQYELQKHELETCQRRVNDLENEIVAYGEWKELSKTFQGRCSKIPDLEKELERLKRENKNIRDTIGNKLQLEEEVFHLQSRLEKQERSQDDNVAFKTQIKSLEADLQEYKAVAADHCAPNTLVTPTALRVRIENILQNDLILMNEKGSAKTDRETAASHVQEYKNELELCKKFSASLQTSLKHHKNSMHRVQKKLSLVAKERDCYKQLIENYEKDLTITNAASELNPDSQTRMKIDMLEKTLVGYKEMCATLEQELHMSKSLPDLGLESPNAENYEKFKKDLEQLRQDNERLQKRKDELEILLEHSSLKGAYNIDKFKVVHLELNPMAEAHEKYKIDVEKLQAEIERLKRKNRKLEEGHEEMTMRINETANITQDLKEMSNLRERVKSLENKLTHSKELYKMASNEFRTVCYLMFGYRIDRLGTNNYRISSMYAEAENEYLNFRLSESGVLDMLETEYSSSLSEMIGVYLREQHSLPAFLCTLTVELFNRTTMA